MSVRELPQDVAELRSPHAIRERCARVLQAGERGDLAHFWVDPERLREVARITAALTRARFPDLQIPPHSRFAHFDAGGVPRLSALERELAARDPRERARVLAGVVVASVLLDAGAGDGWHYEEQDTGLRLSRSEGLAVASLAWARRGGLSSSGKPYDVDAGGLLAVDEQSLALAFQVSEDNPLVGVAGRVHLLRALGEAIESRPDMFGESSRLGGLIDPLCDQAGGGALPAAAILAAVLDGLGAIWPGRIALHGVPLGDVWRHPHAGGQGETAGLVPLHKLSQWLSYSLLHPLAAAGVRVRDLDELTGLAEYRNGGLFVDGGVLLPAYPEVTSLAHEVGSEVIVEWRALTVALLDRVVPLVRHQLGLDAERMPLPAVLEGGTWVAGRELARLHRPGGGPPIRVISDGTVF
jgi:hypothetical protein